VGLLAPLVVARKGVYTDLAKWAKARGHTHLRVDGEFLKLDPWPRLDRFKEHTLELPVADMVITPDRQGHFRVEASVDGRRLDFMVDTGASVIALTERDAGRLGIRPMRSAYTAIVKTANGSVKAAPVQHNSVEIDGIRVRDVRALVLPDDALCENLPGLALLSLLRRSEYRRGKLALDQ